jgi:hypothetical protein
LNAQIIAATPLLLRELDKIKSHPTWSVGERVVALSSLLSRIFWEATKAEQITFSSLFARISFAG